METLTIILDAVNPSDVTEDKMPFLAELKNQGDTNFGRLDTGFPGYDGWGGQGHTVSSSLALAVGQDPTIDGDLANRFRWDEPALPSAKVATHRELDQENYIWNIVDDLGIGALWMNIPTMYPPERLTRGVSISGVLAPPGGRFAMPKQVENKLKDGDYAGDISVHYGSNEKEGWSYVNEDDLQEGKYITDLDKSQLTDEEIKDFAFSMALNRKETFINLYKEYQFDVATVWMSAPDRLRHHLSSFEDPESIEAELLHTVDDCVQEMVEAVEPENLIIHSDHGFGDPAWENNHHARYGFYLVQSDLTWMGAETCHIKDVYPTILASLDISLPDTCQGVPLLEAPSDEDAIKARLENMGYGDED